MSEVQPTIIGLAGTFASGKDTLANYLVERYGYLHISTADMVRGEAQKRYGSIERPVLHKTATEVRHTEGAGAFARRALDEADGKPVIISGIRSLGERDELRNSGAVIVFVDAPIEVRYERMRSRQRDQETQLSLEEFAANEQREWYGGDELADFNMRDIKRDADVVVENVLPLDEFLAQAEARIGIK